MQQVRKWWAQQTADEEKVAGALRLARAAALFGAAIFLMRNFGDAMAI